MAKTAMYVELEFKDGEKQKINIGDFHPTDAVIAQMKSNVMAWNTEFNANKPAWYDLIISSEGANLIESDEGTTNAPIVRAYYETTEITDIPLNG